jgi:hypothetical protein
VPRRGWEVKPCHRIVEVGSIPAQERGGEIEACRREKIDITLNANYCNYFYFFHFNNTPTNEWVRSSHTILYLKQYKVL